MKVKKLLASLMAAIMVIGMVPITAMAVDAEPQKVTATKTISGPDNDGNYTITLTATGNTSTSSTEENLPADIVLVIDSSGSMDKEHSGTHRCSGTIENKVCQKCGHEYYTDHFKTCVQKLDRMDEAKIAAKAFVNGFLTENSKINIGICDFSGTSYTDNSKDHVKAELTGVSGKNSLITTINNITDDHNDGTSYTKGLQEAEGILNGRTNMNKFIIFISDGEPNKGNGIEVANRLKGNGVTIMTVGIDVSGNNMADALKNISSRKADGSYHYYSGSSETLTTILNTLKGTIENEIYAGTNAVMTDIVNTSDFTYEGELTGTDVSESGGTITWNIGNLTSETKTVSFKVKPIDGQYGQLYTNTSVKLKYKDTNGNDQKLENFGKPYVTVLKLAYDANGGIGAPSADTYTSTSETSHTFTVSSTEPTREGYDFVGWKDAAGKEYKAEDTITVTGLTTLYAQWIPKGELSVTKTRVESAPTLTDGTLPEDIVYGNVEIPYSGSVKLLYKVTVTNSNEEPVAVAFSLEPGGSAYTVEDAGAEYVGYVKASGVEVPTISEDEDKTTASGVLGPNELIDLYFVKTFDKDDVTKEGKVENSVTLNGKTPDSGKVETNAKVKVTVTFNTQGGSTVSSQTIDKGSTATKPEDPTKTGYDFKGWYTTSTESTEFNFTSAVNKNTTVYAQWIPKGELSVIKTRVTTAPTLTSGTLPEDIVYDDVEIPYSGSVKLLYKVTVTNSNEEPVAVAFSLEPGGSAYTVKDADAVYIGYDSDDDVEEPNGDGDTVTGELGPGESIDLYFVKTFNKDKVTAEGKVENSVTLNGTTPDSGKVKTGAVVMVTVDFNLNYEGAPDEDVPASQTFESGEKATEPKDPTREGYEFVCWNDKDGKEWDFAKDTVNSNITLYAKWIPEGSLSIEKDRVSSKSDVPADIEAILEEEKIDVTYGNVYIPLGGEVTLLYKVTVENDNSEPEVVAFASIEREPGSNSYKVTDKDAEYIGCDSDDNVEAPVGDGETVTGELGPNESIDLYFTKTFDADDVESGEVSNTAKLEDGPKDTETTDVEVETEKYKVTFKAGNHGYFDDKRDDERIVVDGYKTGAKVGNVVPDVEPDSGYKFIGWELNGDDDELYSDSEVEEMRIKEGDLVFVAQYEKKNSDSGYELPEKHIERPEEKPELETQEHFQYISGYPDGTVRPNANITRAEVATIFYRLLSDDSRNAYYSIVENFSDVQSTDWYLKAVATLTNAGILHGDAGKDTFRPNDSITRAEFATIVSFFDDLSYTGEDRFSDIAGHWANAYINSASANGWINGYPNGTYNPDAAITRAEAMTIINNVLGREVDGEGLHWKTKMWPDNPNYAWYYYEVLEATNYHDYVRESADEAEEWTDIRPNKVWNEGAAN